MKNIEIKARCKNPEKIHDKLMQMGADLIGTDFQIDSYFNVQEGRLKLREGNIENALIAYNRNDQAGAKQSDFKLYRSKDPDLLKNILSHSLGIKVIVKKKRSIYYIDNVKFHIDEVIPLGHFIEIEVTDMEDVMNKEEMHIQCQQYMDLLDVNDKDLVPNSYSDLMLS